MAPYLGCPHMVFLCVCTTLMSLCAQIYFSSVQFSSVKSLSRVLLFAIPWIAAHQASLSITNSQSLLKLMSIDSVMLSSHLILCLPLLFLPPIPPSIRVFSTESTLCMRWPKYWSFGFNISPSNEHPGLISSRMDWLDLLAVQGTDYTQLKREFQYSRIPVPTPVLLPEKSHGQRRLVGSMESQRVRHNWATSLSF